MHLSQYSLQQASQGLEDGDFSAQELTQACLFRIEETEALNAFITVDWQGAMGQAKATDERIARKKRLGPLDGIPVALKDLLITEGIKTTAASKILANYLPPYQGAMAERLLKVGAVILGKTNLDEFAMGSSNEYSAAGACRNPWDTNKVPGGSSGGSAAAVAAGQVFGCLGTDTGGSIRQPASFCGVYGLKPTYSRVSRYGTIAFASSLDQVGPFARTPIDTAHMLQAIAGHDPRDSTSSRKSVPNYLKLLEEGVKGLRVGLPEEYFSDEMDSEVLEKVRAHIEVLKEAGAEIVSVRLPHTQYALSAYYLICTAEASANLARYDGLRYGKRAKAEDLRKTYAASRFQGFGPEVQRRIILGTYVLSSGYYDAYYSKAQKVRTLIRRDFEEVFKEVDLLATPTAPTVAFDIGAKTQDPLSMYLGDICTLAVNLAGIPAISVPAGLSKEHLPIGMQLMGPWFEEGRVLAAAQVLEKEKPAPQLPRNAG